MRLFLIFFLLTACSLARERPNILLIMADDLGIEGLGCYGGASYTTPHLDKLAAEGLRFTHAYSQPLCTPTRVQIMTGKYNHRNWTYFGILDPKEKTFGHLMQQSGYETAIIGKWQLQSYDPPDFPNAERRRGTGMHPKDAGFDAYSLFHALHTEDKGSRYADPSMRINGELKTFNGGFGEDVWVDQVVDFMDRKRNEPTFVYYPMALPHWPFVPTPDSADWKDPSRRHEEGLHYFKDMVEYMDTVVGRLVAQLEAKKLRENTLILFYSDNGTHLKITSKMQDGRDIPGGKATPRQTGIHVPLIANWPGHIKPGLCNDLVDASDFMPTLAELAGAKADPAWDGRSFAPQLFGKAGSPRDWCFFWYDARPGWDKDRFRRHVFALDKTHKLFRDGRFFRISGKPLEEIPILGKGTEADQAARAKLEKVIAGVTADGEPPAVDAFGEILADATTVALRLWPGEPPGETKKLPPEKDLFKQGDRLIAGRKIIKLANVSTPSMTIYPAPPENNTRTAVIICPGGGHHILAYDLEGTEVAEWLNTIGVTGVVLKYRVPFRDPDQRWRAAVQDAQRAVSMLRHRAGNLGIDPQRIGVLGFSAGGQTAGYTALFENDRRYEPVDASDEVSCRPDFSLLIYPAGFVDQESGTLLDHIAVKKSTPPMFFAHAADDRVNPLNSALMFAELKKAGVPAELHVYATGGHGYGLRATDQPVTTWPRRAAGWMREMGWLGTGP